MPKSFVAEQSYFIEAPPKRVFEALTQPRGLVKWFLSEATVVPKRGGAFSFDWLGGYHMTGKLLRYEPGRAVSFQWTDELPDGGTAKTVASFRVTRKGKATLLKLRHSGFVVPEHFAECSSRWAYYLTNLKSVLQRGADLRSPFDW